MMRRQDQIAASLQGSTHLHLLADAIVEDSSVEEESVLGVFHAAFLVLDLGAGTLPPGE